MPPSGDKQQEQKGGSGTPLIEWISAGFGALVTIALLALLSVEALRTADGGPPVLDVRPASLEQRHGLYIVELGISNLSGHTAAAVTIEGELKEGGRSVETSSATVSFVPGHSKRQAGLVFRRDPRRFRLELRATGYEEP